MGAKKFGVVKVPAGIDPSFHSTVYHEAGHLVMAWLLDRDLKSATVSPCDDRAGNVKIGSWRRGRAPERRLRKAAIWYSELVVSLAGKAAEEHAMGRADMRGCSSDLNYAMEITLSLAGDDNGAAMQFLDDASKFAKESLVANWELVELAAFRLFVGETRGPTLTAILDKWPSGLRI